MSDEQKGFAPKPMETDSEVVEVDHSSTTESGQGPRIATPVSVPNAKDRVKQLPTKKKAIIALIALVVVMGIIGSCDGNSSENKDVQESVASTQGSIESSNDETAVEEEQVDKSSLESTIELYESTDSSSYSEDTYKSFKKALDKAKDVDADEDATQNEVDAAQNDLVTAYGALKEVFKPENYETPAYTDVARNPDSFMGEKISFTGKVLQVIEGDSETDLRIATDGGYDDVVFVGFDPSILGSIHVLEDDSVTVYGTCIGQFTYQSTLGGSISLPGLYADQVVIN